LIAEKTCDATELKNQQYLMMPYNDLFDAALETHSFEEVFPGLHRLQEYEWAYSCPFNWESENLETGIKNEELLTE
jgi:hypothetical protein